MNCHLIPQVYLKQWKIPASKNGIFLFDKNEKDKVGTQKKIGNLSDTSFAYENYYVLDERNTSHQFALRNTLSLTDREKYIIETDYFANRVEKNWKNFINYVNTILVNKKVTMVSEQFKDDFLEFFTIQFFRRTENFKRLFMDDILDIIDDMLSDQKLTLEDRIEAIESLFYNALLKQAKGEDNHIKTMVDAFDRLFQTIFLFSHNNTSFISSDNPCFYYNDPNSKGVGTYMPINKKVCAYLVKPQIISEAKYFIVDLSENNTKYINKLISNHAISSLCYDSEKISGLFDDDHNELDWVSSLSKVFLS